PLAGMIFLTTKRNPMLGIIVAFTGVSGGFAANFFLGGTDVILSAITTNAARVSLPGYTVHVESNYYFSIASSFVIILTGFLVTEFVMAKKYEAPSEFHENKAEAEPVITKEERKALRYANFAILAMFGIILLGVIPENGILRNPETGEVWRNSP